MLEVCEWNYPLAKLLRLYTSRWQFAQAPREKLARAFFRPHQRNYYPFKMQMDGIVYSGEFSEYIDWRIFFLGGFERETINLCKFLAPHASFPTFCDIGANRGLFSLLLASSYRNVVAFEPLEMNIEYLSAALEMNSLSNVEIQPFALGEQDTVGDFYVPPKGDSGIGSFVEGHVQNPTEMRKLAIRRGDAFFRERNIRPGLMKIDTEGFEWQVLRGLSDVLHEHRPFIVIEIGDSSKHAIREGGGLHGALPQDYQVFEISDHTTAPQFFLKLLDNDEILGRGISNNLACPAERVGALAPFIGK